MCFLRQTLNTGCISLERSKSGKTATLLLNNNFEVVTAGFERKVWFKPVLKWVESKAFLINVGQQAQKMIRRICLTTKASSVDDHFLYSRDLNI